MRGSSARWLESEVREWGRSRKADSFLSIFTLYSLLDSDVVTTRNAVRCLRADRTASKRGVVLQQLHLVPVSTHLASSFAPYSPRATDLTRSIRSNSLKEYHTRRQQLKNGLTLVTVNATSLLTGSRNRVGVEEERLLKAEKWTLASRAYAAREEVTRAKARNQDGTSQGCP